MFSETSSYPPSFCRQASLTGFLLLEIILGLSSNLTVLILYCMKQNLISSVSNIITMNLHVVDVVVSRDVRQKQLDSSACIYHTTCSLCQATGLSVTQVIQQRAPIQTTMCQKGINSLKPKQYQQIMKNWVRTWQRGTQKCAFSPFFCILASFLFLHTLPLPAPAPNDLWRRPTPFPPLWSSFPLTTLPESAAKRHFRALWFTTEWFWGFHIIENDYVTNVCFLRV